MTPYTIRLRIRHPSIDPAEVTRILGKQPTHAWKAGTARNPAQKDPNRSTHADSYWLAPIGLPASPPPAGALGRAGSIWHLEPHIPIDGLLAGQARLLMTHKAFFERLKAEGGSCALLVSISTRERWEVDWPPALLRMLGEMNMGLSIDVDKPGASDDAEP